MDEQVFSYFYPLALPIAGLCIPRVNNPVILAPSTTSCSVEVRLVEVADERYVEVMTSSPLESSRSSKMLRKFIQELERGTGLSIPFSIRCRVDCGELRAPAMYYYAACSNAAIRVLSGSESLAEEGYLLKSCIATDAVVGLNPSLVGGYRYSIELGSAVAYHYGEEPVTLRGITVEVEGPMRVARIRYLRESPRIASMITKLIGYLVLEGVAALRSGSYTVISRIYAYENGLAYALYGLEPPADGYPWRWVIDGDYAYLYRLEPLVRG